LRFLRRLIDTGLMSPDVVRLDAGGVVGELRAGRAVAAILPRSAVTDDGLLFTGFPGSGGAGPERSTLVTGTAGVVMAQSRRQPAAIHTLDRLRSESVGAIDPALLAGSHAPPVTPHYRLLVAATADLMERVVSGASTVDAAVRAFGAVARLLAR
jgi:hypothetical protein